MEKTGASDGEADCLGQFGAGVSPGMCYAR